MDLDINKIIREVYFNFSRSGGKGGQNVNKVETKVELIFNIRNSRIFDDVQKGLLFEKLKNRIDSEGNLRIVSQAGRTQLENRRKAIEKFVGLIKNALKKKKKRLKTVIPKSVKEKILESKRRDSEKKKQRKKIELD